MEQHYISIHDLIDNSTLYWLICLPFEDQIEPISYHSHPDELDPDRFFQMEPDGKEDEEGVPQICRKGDKKKPSLGVFVMGLQVLGATHSKPVQCIHHTIHV